MDELKRLEEELNEELRARAFKKEEELKRRDDMVLFPFPLTNWRNLSLLGIAIDFFTCWLRWKLFSWNSSRRSRRRSIERRWPSWMESWSRWRRKKLDSRPASPNRAPSLSPFPNPRRNEFHPQTVSCCWPLVSLLAGITVRLGFWKAQHGGWIFEKSSNFETS